MRQLDVIKGGGNTGNSNNGTETNTGGDTDTGGDLGNDLESGGSGSVQQAKCQEIPVSNLEAQESVDLNFKPESIAVNPPGKFIVNLYSSTGNENGDFFTSTDNNLLDNAPITTWTTKGCTENTAGAQVEPYGGEQYICPNPDADSLQFIPASFY